MYHHTIKKGKQNDSQSQYQYQAYLIGHTTFQILSEFSSHQTLSSQNYPIPKNFVVSLVLTIIQVYSLV